MIRASPYSLRRISLSHSGYLPIFSLPRSIYVFFCTCMSSRLALPLTHWSVGHTSIFFLLLFFLCCNPLPRSFAFFLSYNSRFLFFLRSLHRYCQFVCFQCTQRFINNESIFSVQQGPNPIYCLMSSTTLYQSAILQDDKHTPSTSTSVCNTRAYSSCGSDLSTRPPRPM